MSTARAYISKDKHKGVDLVRMYEDPGYFMTQVFGAELTTHQKELNNSILQGYQRIALRSGHGTGKTFFIAGDMLQFVGTRPQCKGLATSTKEDQITGQIWAEARLLLTEAPKVWQEGLAIDGSAIYRKGNKFGARIYAQVAKKENPNAFRGWHHKHLRIWTDESPGIPDIIMEQLEGACTEPDNRWMMTGNPTLRTGYFHAAFHEDRESWKGLHWNSLDSPLVSPAYPLRIEKKYGLNSNPYRYMVEGKFPLQDDDALVLFEWAKKSAARDIEETPGSLSIGVDPARSVDGDATGLCARMGDVAMEVEEFWTKDEMEVVGKAIQFAKKLCRIYGLNIKRDVTFYVDVIGIGAGAHDRLKEQGYKTVEVNVAMSAGPVRDENEPTFFQLRDQLWWKLRDFVRLDGRIPDHEKLIDELTAPKYGTTSTGKIKIESKESMKKRGVKSPNMAEALMCTFHTEQVFVAHIGLGDDEPEPKEMREIEM